MDTAAYSATATATATLHFTARVSGSSFAGFDVPIGYFANADQATQYADQLFPCGMPYSGSNGTLDFVFLTAAAG